MRIFSLNPLMKQTPEKLNTAGLKTFTQKSAHTSKRIQTQKTQKGGLPHAPTASALLTEHTDWPGLKFINTRHTRSLKRLHRSMPRAVWYYKPRASAADLLKLRREHWTIENKLHWIRTPSFKRMPHASEPVCSLKPWQLCETPQSPSYDSQDFTDALQLLQNLNSQLTS